MLFNSFPFVVFFAVVTSLYFLLPHKVRWVLLLAASCFFYMYFKPIYILILAFTIVIDYYAGLWIENASGKNRKLFLIMSIIANVGVLSFFKYYNFFAENVNHICSWTHNTGNIPLLHIILPIGLSFHTFQAMSYTIEVYRGNQKAEKHFGIYALYVMFYPQLVAGPIERPQNMLHQFHEKHEFDYDNVVYGLRMILWGLFKKAVVADRLAVITDPIFNNPQHYSATMLIIGTVFFAIEIFCDFSGYSNIAIGTARVMGYKLMVNFNRPYSAKSISEFWRRWHISLSTWFYDYLFIPIATSMRYMGLMAVVTATVITFLVSGLWHGAAWHYVVWGGLHGVAIGYEVLTKKIRKKIFKPLPKGMNNFISRFFTFGYVCIGYIFFRANTLSDAIYIVKKLPSVFGDWIAALRTHMPIFDFPVTSYRVCLSIFVIAVMEAVHMVQNKNNLNSLLQRQPRYMRWAIYYIFAFMILFIGVFQNRQFIYFQF